MEHLLFFNFLCPSRIYASTILLDQNNGFLYRFHFTAHKDKSFLGRPVLLSNLSS